MDFKAKLKHEWPAFAILVAATVARLTLLGMKPPHFDEGVNGWFVDQMTHTGFYHYDPGNYHGPLHFYVLFLMQTLFGRHVWALRLPLALVSLAAVWLTLRFERYMGRGPALWAAAAMAVSPGCVFYGRYAIHEYWLVYSLMLCAWGLAGLWQTGERKALWALWIGITGAVLTKETYVIHFACAALALGCTWVLGLLSRPAEEATARQQWTRRDMALGLLMFVGCVIFFYSGGGMDLPGLKGLYLTFHEWAHTGKAGNGHEKSPVYWLQLIAHYEWPTFAGMLVAILCFLPRTPRFIRALGIYGCGALAAYSIIHYKTPWCIVSLTWPFLLLYGWGVDFLLRKYGPPVGVVAATILAANLCDMVWLNYFHYTDPAQQYVYVQTFDDVNKLMDPLDKLVGLDASNYQLSGNIILDSYHPLPWMLGDYPNTAYYDDDATPPTAYDADFLLVEETKIDDVEKKLHGTYFTDTLRLRDSEDDSRLYLSAKKFQAVFPGRKPDLVPAKPASPSPAPAK